MAKYFLDEDGVRVVVNAFNANLEQKANKTDLNGYATQSYVNEKVDGIEPYDDSEIRGMIENVEAKTSGIYHFKGSVANLEALAAIENPEVGDTYNLADTGMNAAWTGSEWDNFGSIVDLSEYAKTDDIQSIVTSKINEILYSGKSAVVSDVDGLKAMLNNEQSEVEITLNDDITLSNTVLFPAGKKVTLNLNGNELNSTKTVMQIAGEVKLSGGSVKSNTYAVIVVAGGKLTVDGANVTSTASSAIEATGANAQVIINSGEITAQEVGVLVFNNSEVTINGGHIQDLDNFAVGGNGTAGRGGSNVTVNGGTIEGHIQSAGYIAAGIYWPNEGILTINGGNIISDGAGIVMRGGVVNLNNGANIVANGESGVIGKVGDSSVTVGPYAVVYDQKANYPAVDSLQLNIAQNAALQGTDGDLSVLLADGATANIVDNRNA